MIDSSQTRFGSMTTSMSRGDRAISIPVRMRTAADVLASLAPAAGSASAVHILSCLYDETGGLSRPALSPMSIHGGISGLVARIYDLEGDAPPLVLHGCEISNVRISLLPGLLADVVATLSTSGATDADAVRLSRLVGVARMMSLTVEQPDLF